MFLREILSVMTNQCLVASSALKRALIFRYKHEFDVDALKRVKVNINIYGLWRSVCCNS